MTLNENFKTKLEELEAARDAVDKTEIEAKLDELRREKDGLGRGPQMKYIYLQYSAHAVFSFQLMLS